MGHSWMRTSQDCNRVCISERDAKIKNRRTNATKKDLVVVLVCLIFLVINLGAIGSGGRERAKRAVCLKNLRQLALAWTQYANDNDGFLVNGAPYGRQCEADLGSGDHEGERPWTGTDWDYSWVLGEQLPEECQESAIRAGALWPYCQELKLYRCPTGYPGDMRNYAIVDSMNGLARSGTKTAGVWIKNRMRIYKPGERAVFIDEGWISPDSFGVHYEKERWWDDPPVRHSDGATLSFADGHSEYWKWKGSDTIDYGRESDRTHPGSHYSPETPEGREDLHRLQKAVWGRLGYMP